MSQTGITIEWLLEGFKYELGATCRPATVEYYCGEIRRFLQWANATGVPSDIRLITKHHIQGFFHFLSTKCETGGSKGNGQDTERLRWPYYRALRRFFSWVVREGYLDRNPMDGIYLKAPEPVPVEPYRREHIDRMLKVLQHDWEIAKTQRQKMLAARDRALLLLFLESGLRLGEMARLRIVDIDLNKQRVSVWLGKRGKSRLAGFGPQTRKALWRYLSLCPPGVEGDALWVTEEGTPLSVGGVQIIIRRLKNEAGLGHVKGSVHKLRHTFANSYLRHTRDMKGCRILLGHATLAMTERYTQFIEAEDALKGYNGQGPLDWLMT